MGHESLLLGLVPNTPNRGARLSPVNTVCGHHSRVSLIGRMEDRAGRVVRQRLRDGRRDSGIESATLTLALPKAGLFRAAGRQRAGRVFLGDIGIPGALYRRLGLEAGLPFASGRIVRFEAET